MSNMSDPSSLEVILKQNDENRINKFVVTDKENLKLIQEHKYDKLVRGNTIMVMLNEQRKQDNIAGYASSEEIDMAAYYKAINEEKMIMSETQKKEEVETNDWIISYYSRRRLVFEFVTCILVIFDCGMVPFRLAFGKSIFDETTEKALTIVDVMIKMIFGVDLLIGFRKAFFNE